MPRRKPRNLDAYRYELGTYERQLAKDFITVQGIKAAALPLGAGLLGLGLATAGFLAYNKVDDLKEWLSDGWEDGFGLVNDPAQTQTQVSNYISPTRTPPGFEGMATSEIYALHYDMRVDIMDYFARHYCEFQGIEWTGENYTIFKNTVWAESHLGYHWMSPTYRFERVEVQQVAGEDVNEISEYTYQMIIRETDSRNTQARLTSGIVGAASTGIGAAFSEATHWALRSSGFMRGSDGWNGQNWEEAPGANRDPLLMFAWGRTDFQTGKWWSTVDSQGDVAFWLDVYAGRQGGARIRRDTGPNPETGMADNFWTYEQIIYYAHQEISSGEWGPFLLYLSDQGGMPLSSQSTEPVDPPPALTEEEEESIRDQGEREQEESSNETGRDDYMPGEEPPEEEEHGSHPPPGWGDN